MAKQKQKKKLPDPRSPQADLAQAKRNELIARLRCEQWTFRAIGEHPEVRLTHTQVRRIVQEVIEEYHQLALEHIPAHKARALSELAHQERELWNLYWRSTKEHGEVSEERTEADAGKGKKGAGNRKKVKVRKHGRDGNVQVMREIREVRRLRYEILGLVDDEEMPKGPLAKVVCYLPIDDPDEAAEGSTVVPRRPYALKPPKQIEAEVIHAKKHNPPPDPG